MHLSRYSTLFILLFSSIFFACAQNKPVDFLTNQNRLKATAVLLNNSESLIPLKNLNTLKIASIFTSPSMSSILTKYDSISNLNSLFQVEEDYQNGLDTINNFNTLIIQVDDKLLSNKRFIETLENVSKKTQLIITGFGSMKSLAKLNDIKAPIIWNHNSGNFAEMISAEIIFGGIAAEGRLQTQVSSNFNSGDGFSTEQTRLRYTIPEAVGIDGKKLIPKIDAIAEEMIDGKAAPGAVVLIVKDNNVIFEKAYGNHYYDVKESVKTNDIFDMASISKIAATTLAVMRLDEQNAVDLNKSIGDYLMDAKNTNKAAIKVRDVMLHQAGFIPFIPFYRDLTDDDFRTEFSADYPVKVSENYYLKKDYFENVMWPLMLNSKVKPPGDYVYSDISMYVMQRIVEAQSGMSLDNYVSEQFYDQLGMYSTGFNPRERFPASRMVPTELDKSFRNSQLIGYVHDQGAAMAGGVAGHAGLFSTANDLAIYGQLLLNKGTYGGEQYFKPETVDKYTSRYSDNSRRGLGFDKGDPDTTKTYPSKLAPASVFGHTGYTGTAIWMDPDQKLIYIFLSNRVQPDVSPYLSKLEIRSRILDAIYEAIPKN